jgi:hypothetical protein
MLGPRSHHGKLPGSILTTLHFFRFLQHLL